MYYELIGFARFSGKSSKTGRDYDFYRVHLSTDWGRNQSGVGSDVITVMVDPSFAVNLTGNDIGARCRVAFDQRGRVIDLTVE